MSSETVTGKVVTVRGPVAPDDLGVTIMHEHLFIDLRKSHQPHKKWAYPGGRPWPGMENEGFPATELAIWDTKVGLGNLYLARESAPIADNYVLADEQLATQELLEFKNTAGAPSWT